MIETLSIIGLYTADNSIFDGLQLPDGVDHDCAVNHIMMHCAELETAVSDPGAMKELIKIWSAGMLPVWKRIYSAVTEEYNPLHNYDRTETHELKETRDLTSGSSSSASGTSGTDETVTGKVAGFNSDDLQNSEETGTSGKYTSSGNASGKTTENGTVSHSDTIRAYGNIGVTTSQQMLQAELDLADKTNIYQYISDDFKRQFCILIY